MSHLRTRGMRRARRLPAVVQRKLATCHGAKGRICFASQRNSPGILECSTASQLVNQHRRGTSELKHRHCYSPSSRESARRSLFAQSRWILLEIQRCQSRVDRPICSEILPELPVMKAVSRQVRGKGVSIWFHDGTILTMTTGVTGVTGVGCFWLGGFSPNIKLGAFPAKV